MKKKNSILISIIIFVLVVGVTLGLLEKIKTNKYLFKTVNVSLNYPKGATEVEIIEDDRDIVDEHVKFEISNRKFEENLVVEVAVTNNLYIECVDIECRGPFADELPPSTTCKGCGYFERLVDCEIVGSVSPYCSYYEEKYISKSKKDSYTQRFGPVLSYISEINNWKKAPDNFQGEWPEGKTRKIYYSFTVEKSESMKGKEIQIIGWFKTGDEKAEKAIDKIVRYGLNILE